MADAIAVSGISSKKSSSACPKVGRAGHTSSTTKCATLSSAQVRATLETIDIAPGSRLARYAAYRAFTADIEVDDLLQEGICRTMASRNCPSHVPMEHFLMGVMRSIASKVIERRERARDALFQYARAYPDNCFAADEKFAFDERADLCRRSIEKVVAGQKTVEAIIDGIGEGLCGEALADFAGIDHSELATVRRKIKRRVANVWVASLASLDEAA